ncbi:MAG: helix-hairpin-helix domain-containing protein [Opitutaceae bacterium]
MHLWWLLIPYCLLSTLLNGSDKVVDVWQVLDNCKLLEADDNDGDSFLIQYGSEKDVFRLYYVDTLETNTTYMDRVQDQARYFSIAEQDVIASGELAAQFSKRFLQGTFTAYTKWEDARGSSGTKRYYALIKKDDRYLSTELVKNGLARIYGMPTKQAWPTGYAPRTYLSLLKNTERQTQQSRTGIWAIASDSKQMAGLQMLQGKSELSATDDSSLTTLPTANRGSSKTGMIDVNTATTDELKTLPGIGPALASRIIQARPIESIDALVNVSGISDKTLAGFRSLIIVAEPPPPPNTVVFYLADLDTYLNTEITLNIQSVEQREIDSPESFRAVRLHTATNGEAGGNITAFIPDEFYDSFLTFYSTPNKALKGLLYDQDGETVLVYRRK